jgi:hypothetical protein
MRLLCYRSSASEDVQEQVWTCSEYVHAYSIKGYLEFYIREDRVAWALLVDPFMRHIRHKDLIV